jgi:hypothetical protein
VESDDKAHHADARWVCRGSGGRRWAGGKECAYAFATAESAMAMGAKAYANKPVEVHGMRSLGSGVVFAAGYL